MCAAFSLYLCPVKITFRVMLLIHVILSVVELQLQNEGCGRKTKCLYLVNFCWQVLHFILRYLTKIFLLKRSRQDDKGQIRSQ